MLHAIIVDDESMICQLIIHLVDWKSLDIQIDGIAHDGQSAFSLIQEKQPNIVITDIRIPVFDGLELINRVQQCGLSTRFIVISGYRYFEYARSALRYGVTEYLLKPINAQELTQALMKLSSEIRAELQESESQATIRENLTAAAGRIRRQFFSDVIEKKHMMLSSDTPQSEYGISFASVPIHAFLIKASCRDLTEYELMPLVFSRVKPILYGALQPLCSMLEIVIIRSRLYCFFQFHTSEDDSKLNDIYQRISVQFEDILISFEAFVLTMYLAGKADTPEEIPELIHRLQHTVAFRLLDPNKRILDIGKMQTLRTISIQAVFSHTQETAYCKILEIGDRKKTEDGIRNIFRPLNDGLMNAYDPNILMELCERIMILTQNTLRSELPELHLSSALRAADHALSLFSVIEQFIQTMLGCLEEYFVLSEQKPGAPVWQAMRYIEQHFTEPLTLDSVAEQTGLSPSYLSTLFKKESSYSFNEYLTLCRLNEAKRLLRQTSEPITLIAERSGYMDAKYFSKVFSKAFGISPQKYRSL